MEIPGLVVDIRLRGITDPEERITCHEKTFPALCEGGKMQMVCSECNHHISNGGDSFRFMLSYNGTQANLVWSQYVGGLRSAIIACTSDPDLARIIMAFLIPEYMIQTSPLPSGNAFICPSHVISDERYYKCEYQDEDRFYLGSLSSMMIPYHVLSESGEDYYNDPWGEPLDTSIRPGDAIDPDLVDDDYFLARRTVEIPLSPLLFFVQVERSANVFTRFDSECAYGVYDEMEGTTCGRCRCGPVKNVI